MNGCNHNDTHFFPSLLTVSTVLLFSNLLLLEGDPPEIGSSDDDCLFLGLEERGPIWRSSISCRDGREERLTKLT